MSPTDLILGVAFAVGGVLAGWMGIGGFTGAWWAVLSVLSGVLIGAYLEDARHEKNAGRIP